MSATMGEGGEPVGHASMKAPWGVAAVLTTVKLTEMASAPAGIPHFPVTSQFRDSELAKMPPWIGAPLPRVSATRQGRTPMKVLGGVTSVMVWITPLTHRAEG